MMERELLLLGLLRRVDMHGYQLHEFINRYMVSCTDLKKPTAYYLLDKLQERGWIAVAREEIGENNRPPRRVYQVTEAGESAFQRLLRENLTAYHSTTFPGNIGLAFLDTLNRDEALLLLKERQATLSAELTAARSIPVHEGSMQFVIDHQIHHLESEVAWLDKVIARLT
jgi:DNA-binding PadR family transcriptional regulator